MTMETARRPLPGGPSARRGEPTGRLEQNHFGDIRRKRKLTLLGAAARIGVDVSALGKWERKTHTPSLGYIARMAEVYGVTIEELAPEILLGPNDIRKYGRGGNP